MDCALTLPVASRVKLQAQRPDQRRAEKARIVLFIFAQCVPFRHVRCI
jgi:hypothetical protein